MTLGTIMHARGPPAYKGRNLGLVILVAAQLLIGVVHFIFGVWLLSAQTPASFLGASSGAIYSIYTVAFGVSTLVFAAGLWGQRRWGWVGAVSVAVFVIAVDLLTLLALPSIPGIPKFAGYGEIPYSAIVFLYLMQGYIRQKYKLK